MALVAVALRFEGAAASNTTVYDWTYLILADRLGCEMVTADARFYRAVQQHPTAASILWIEEL